jgi:Zn-dependent peptidase ImmA (M78 family)
MRTDVRQQARRDAQAMLTWLWTRGYDHAPLPVDPVTIARRLGIRVVFVDLESDVADVLVKDPGLDPRIGLNRQDTPSRQRFACAHALGHYTLHKDDPDSYEYVDEREFLGPDATGEEVYANEFAAALVIPELDVRLLARDFRSEVLLAWRFDVAREAMHRRLEGLGLATA